MFRIRNFWAFILLNVFLVFAVVGNSVTASSIVADDNKKQILMQKINLENNIKGSVGALLNVSKDNDIFVLLGKERKGKSGEGTWCELGGSVKDGETLLQATIRETEEESGGIYKLKEHEIINYATIYYNEYKKDNGFIRKEMYVFLKVPNYYNSDEILKEVNKQKNINYKEKDEFKWVKLSDLIKCKNNPCIVHDINGDNHNILLRTFFYKALQKKEFQEQLKLLIIQP